MNNNVVQEQNQVRVETKVKKIYLVDNKNDIQQKQAQEELKKRPSGNVRTAPREPRRYIVSVLNDDFTTFEFVIEIMMTIFNKSRSEAEAIAESTHLHQKANVGISENFRDDIIVIRSSPLLSRV